MPSLIAQLVKNPPAMQEIPVRFLGWEDTLEKGKATHSIILAWRSPWTVQPMGLQRVGQDWATFIFAFKYVLEDIYYFSIWIYNNVFLCGSSTEENVH